MASSGACLNHVRLTPADRQRSAHDELALDLTRDELERRFLTPRLENRPVTVGGRTLAWEQIERIRINQTTESSEKLLPRIRAAQAADPIAVVGITDEWYVTKEGREVTDELITEPVGSAAALVAPQASGLWFHVRVGDAGLRGLLRQGEEFNLSEAQVLEQFALPWREGRDVILDGKAFSPTKARLTVYAGPRLTTHQRGMGQGWVNAIASGEDVTGELLGTNRPSSHVGLAGRSAPQRDPRSVAVAHGRDDQARRAMFGFLQDLGLTPLDWGSLRARTGHTNPYTGDVVELAFQVAQAVVVLFTPDDEARLHPELAGEDEPEHERRLTGQPRSNVILEAGMALISHPDRTIIVELGRLRPISNLAGRNTVRITGSDTTAKLNELASRLETAQCPVNRHGTDWLDTQRFAQLAALTRRASAGVSATPTQVDDLLLEVRAAAERAEVSLPVSHDQDVVAFLRDRREPFDSGAGLLEGLLQAGWGMTPRA